MQKNVVEGLNVPIFETDHAFRPTYPVNTAPVDIKKAIEVELITLETLAAQYNVPHFKIEDFEKLDALGIQTFEGWALHFTHIANSGLVVAYEKKKETGTGEPCAAVIGKEREMRV